ncbi:MAG: 3',5'-cyclic-nucleotide phosphodiesterase [Betaproteobacteria bacterium]|nr:3',5'-cyclic-nucleotide phosphodiesterase [Betaproteobacteria bacterium]
MKIRILGCSGGIGDGRHTTTLLLDHDILLDAGTGAMSLSRDELARIDHVFLTHSHLDHILSLPLLLDSVAGERGHPLTVHAIPEVLQILRDHLFNWHIWPDFTRIPTPEAPFLHFQPIRVGETVRLGTRELTPIPANHVVPAVGYLMRDTRASLLFSGDTASHDALWECANAQPDLENLIVECSFADALADIARASKHYCPQTLAPDMARLKPGPAVWITHLKPGGEAEIMAQLSAACRDRPRALQEGMAFEV